MVLTFHDSQIIFNVFTVVAFLLVFLILLIYQRAGGNVLLRSCSAMLLVMLGLILIGSAVYENDMSTRGQSYCKCQAVMLNYCHISVHGLIACMMFDAWSHVSNWRPRKQKLEPVGKRRAFSPGYIFCSFVLPLVPTVILIIFIFISKDESPIQEHTYYCHVNIYGTNALPYVINLLWIMLYSLVGISCSVYLLVKTIWTRHKSMRSGRTTHLTILSIVRVAIATVSYILITIMAIAPVYTVTCPTLTNYTSRLNDLAKNPYQNPNLCFDMDSNHINGLLYWAFMRCPKWYRDLLPCCIGIGFFLMYGFGKHAKKAYVDIYHRCRDCTVSFTCFFWRRAKRSPDAPRDEAWFASDRGSVIEYPPKSSSNPYLMRNNTIETEPVTTQEEWDGNVRDWYDANASSGGEDVGLHLRDALAMSTTIYDYYEDYPFTAPPDAIFPLDLHPDTLDMMQGPDHLAEEGRIAHPLPKPEPLPSNAALLSLLQMDQLPVHMRFTGVPIPKPKFKLASSNSQDDMDIENIHEIIAIESLSKSCPY